jgi:hypothetical protein
VTSLASTLTDWIGALSAAALGVLGFGFTLWQWRGTGFRPRMDAAIDTHRVAIRLDIENRGRAAGAIWRVVPVQLVDGQNHPIDHDVQGFDGGYEPKELPAFAAMRLVVKVKEPEDGSDPTPFPEDVEILVEWGGGNETFVEPEPVEGDRSLWTVESRLPPSTT